MNRRLLLAIPYFPPDTNSGGAEMFSRTLAEGLARNHGWEVTIVTTMPKARITTEVTSSNISVHRLPYRFKLSNSPVSISWVRELRKVIATVNPDVINVNLPVPGLGDLVCNMAGARPVVLYYHFGSMKRGRLLLDPVIWLYESFVLPFSLRKAESIVCGTEYVRDGILHKFSHKTTLVAPGVDVNRFRPAVERVHEPRILFVGSLNLSDNHKCFPDLLAACRILLEDIPDLRLSVVGGGTGLQAHKDLAIKLGIAESVDFHGRLEGDELAESYRSAAVLAVPSMRETFGMVITEGMASALPVVAVNGGGVSSVLDNHKDGLLVPPRDPPAMAHALRFVLKDHVMAATLGQAGRRKVVEKYSWEGQIAAMSQILSAVCDVCSTDKQARKL